MGSKVITMETRRIVVSILIINLISLSSQHRNTAEECRVYQLIGGTSRYKSPCIHVENLLTVSFYNPTTAHFPNRTSIILQGNRSNVSVTLYINDEGEVIVVDGSSKNMTLGFEQAPFNHSWVTMAVQLHDSQIVIYRTDMRENVIADRSTLGTNVKAHVSSSGLLYVVLNCPAGCFVHDHTSYLVDRKLPLVGDGATLYVRHEEGAQNAMLMLGFTDAKGNYSKLSVNLTKIASSQWHKVNITHNKDKHVIVFVNNEEKATAMVADNELAFSIFNSTTVLWSLYCYPGNPTGQNDTDIDTPEETPTSRSEGKEGAGIGEVLAWVLAGMALFLVMIMALLLCTKMGPKENSFQYGASVGVITSFGRNMTNHHDAVREAEEDTEPDSPTLLSPVININPRTPEEVDEDQDNSKML